MTLRSRTRRFAAVRRRITRQGPPLLPVLLMGAALLFSGYLIESSQAALNREDTIAPPPEELAIDFSSLGEEGFEDLWMEEQIDHAGRPDQPNRLNSAGQEAAVAPYVPAPRRDLVIPQSLDRYIQLLPGEKLALQAPISGREGSETVRRYWRAGSGRITEGENTSWTAPETPGLTAIELVEERLAGGRVLSQNVLKTLTAVVNVPLERRGADGYLNGYLVGFFQTERESASVLGAMGRSYRTPSGLIEVTEQNKDLPLSEHFRLGQFTCHWNAGVWPKYILLDFRLIEKLEAVFDEMEKRGFAVENVEVISGFRSPAYNRNMGRGRWSAHTFGLACDFFIDNNRDGRMDDLNGDGYTSTADAKVIQEIVLEFDRAGYLPGGSSCYSGHGSPFIHVDVRGMSVTW